jgi:hypothetical protein
MQWGLGSNSAQSSLDVLHLYEIFLFVLALSLRVLQVFFLF